MPDPAWIVVVKSWDKGTQESAAYVETEYFGTFPSEADADAFVPHLDPGLQSELTRELLTAP